MWGRVAYGNGALVSTFAGFRKAWWRFAGWLAYLFARGVIDVLNVVWWRTEIRGASNIPSTGAFILAPTHRSNIDGPLAASLTRRKMRFLAKRELFGIEVLGQLFRSMGAISVNRGAPDRASLNSCKNEIDAGWPLVLFPEGARRDGPLVAEVLEGAVYLALRCGVPVIPVGIAGSEQANPRRSFWLRPVKIAVVIGEPLQFESGEGNRIPRSSISQAKETLTVTLQRLLDEAMARRS